jgi:hypothetical protein
MRTLTLLLIAGLVFVVCSTSARELNCDPTALTYDIEECAARSVAANKVKGKSKNNTELDAAALYNKKFQKLDVAKKAKVNPNNDEKYGVYLATSNKRHADTIGNLTSKKISSKNATKKLTKKGFEEVGISAKIPLKPKNDS